MISREDACWQSVAVTGNLFYTSTITIQIELQCSLVNFIRLVGGLNYGYGATCIGSMQP